MKMKKDQRLQKRSCQDSGLYGNTNLVSYTTGLSSPGGKGIMEGFGPATYPVAMINPSANNNNVRRSTDGGIMPLFKALQQQSDCRYQEVGNSGEMTTLDQWQVGSNRIAVVKPNFSDLPESKQQLAAAAAAAAQVYRQPSDGGGFNHHLLAGCDFGP